MQERTQFYINGEWVDPAEPRTIEVINPATEEPIGRIGMGSAADVDKAVQAARAAFETYGQTSREQRLELMGRIVDAFKGRFDEIADTISAEMGAPTTLAHKAQAPTGIGHFKAAMRVLKDYAFEETLGTTVVRREPVGVCGFITPWNWPINQITCKVAPALAAGCTMVLKPSKVAPLRVPGASLSQPRRDKRRVRRRLKLWKRSQSFHSHPARAQRRLKSHLPFRAWAKTRK